MPYNSHLVAWQIPSGIGRSSNILPTLLDRVRVLFNDAIPFLETKPLHPLKRDEQLEWWRGLNHNETRLWVYTLREGTDPTIVGFLKLTDRGSYVTPLFVLDKKYWGRGLGEEIIQHYLQQASPKPLAGSQLVSNPAICYMNKKAGWLIERTENGVQHLWHPNGTERRLSLQRTCDEFMRYNEEA
jgi:GNAT superfamily N-acetyltransferase